MAAGWGRCLACVVVVLALLATGPARGLQPPGPEVLASNGAWGPVAWEGSIQHQLRVYSRLTRTWPSELQGTSRRVLEILTRYVPATRTLSHVIRVEEVYLEQEARAYFGAEDSTGQVLALSRHRLVVDGCDQGCGLRHHLEEYEVPLPAEALRLAPGEQYCVRFLARQGDRMLGGVLRWCVTGVQMAAHLRAVEGEARFHRLALPGQQGIP